MKRFAQIEYGKAHWVFEAEEKPEFAPNIVLIDITDRPEVQEGWSYDAATGTFTEPQPSHLHVWDGEKWVIDIEKFKADKKAEIADARWRAETGGMTFNGIEVATDRESQALLMGAVLAAQNNPQYKANWKAKNGWFELDAATLIAIADAVRSHVQACFDREKELQEQVEAATTIEELEIIKW